MQCLQCFYLCYKFMMANEKMMKRAPNFSADEEELLLAIIGKYKDIVECKLSDHINLRKKESAWECIEADFNAESKMVHRSRDNLINKYSNIKKKSKKKFADEKISIKGTGGGPPVTAHLTGTDHAVANLLGARLTGRSSLYDDDHNENDNCESESQTQNDTFAIPQWQEELLDEEYQDEQGLEQLVVVGLDETEGDVLQQSQPSLPGDSIMIGVQETAGSSLKKTKSLHESLPSCSQKTPVVVPIKKMKINESSGNQFSLNSKPVWKGQTTALLKTAISSPLRTDKQEMTKGRRNVQDQISKWAKAKVLANKTYEMYAKEEHEEKLLQQKEEHEARMLREEKIHALEEEERKQRIKYMEQIYKLEIEEKKAALANKILEKQLLLEKLSQLPKTS